LTKEELETLVVRLCESNEDADEDTRAFIQDLMREKAKRALVKVKREPPKSTKKTVLKKKKKTVTKKPRAAKSRASRSHAMQLRCKA